METAALTLCYEVAEDVQLGKFDKLFISQLALNIAGGIRTAAAVIIFQKEK